MKAEELRRGQHFISISGSVRITILTPGLTMCDVLALTSDSNTLGISGCTLKIDTRIILEDFHLQSED